jgi:hypothetical protein
VSLKAELNPGYVNSLIKEGKEPAVEHVFRLCAVLNVSATYVLFGITVSPETERIMRAVENDPARQRSRPSPMRSLLNRRPKPRVTRSCA